MEVNNGIPQEYIDEQDKCNDIGLCAAIESARIDFMLEAPIFKPWIKTMQEYFDDMISEAICYGYEHHDEIKADAFKVAVDTMAKRRKERLTH